MVLWIYWSLTRLCQANHVRDLLLKRIPRILEEKDHCRRVGRKCGWLVFSQNETGYWVFSQRRGWEVFQVEAILFWMIAIMKFQKNIWCDESLLIVFFPSLLTVTNSKVPWFANVWEKSNKGCHLRPFLQVFR